MKSRRILLAALLASTLLTTNAAALDDGFEDLTPPFGPATTDDYTILQTGTGSAISTTAEAHTGTKSVRLQGGNFNEGFDTTEHLCGASWWVNFGAWPVGSNYNIGITTLWGTAPFDDGSAAGEWAAFQITPTGTTEYRYDTNAAGSAAAGALFGLSMTLDTWYNFQILCQGVGVSGALTFYESTTSTVVNVGAQDFTNPVTILAFAGNADNTNAGAYTAYIDDLTFPFEPLESGVRFCANPLEHDAAGHASSDNPNYGYTYRRGASSFDQSEADEPGIGLSTGFGFDGTSSESTWDYSAKQFTTGSEAMHANITLEAAVDFGASSVFRVNFATVSGATPSSTSKGDGLTTGNFANHAEAEFTENGNVWQIKLWYVTGGGSRTQLGPAVNHGSANDARSYSIWSDNRGSTPWIAVKDSAGATVITSNSTAPGTLATFQTAFAGDEILDIWYVGYGTGILDATTAIDNNEAEAGNSTCMFDDVGTAVAAGSAGTSPADLTPPDIDPTPEDDCVAVFCPPAGGIGGLSSSQVSLFLGIVIVASFAASMNEKTGAGAAGLAIFALLGTFIAYALGYIPLWVILVLFAIGLGAIFLGLFNSGKSEAT